MGDRPASVRIHDFLEVDTGLTPDEAVIEAERCIQCKKPGCVKGCPVGIDIPAFIAAVAQKDFVGAAAIIKEENLLPAICGRVCPQEVQCEGVCILGVKEQPVRIGALERFVADWEREHAPKIPAVAEPTGYRVAVVGSGPAGLAASFELAKRGHQVTMFESLHAPGGVLMYGIPAFRLPKDVVQAEVDQLREMGVDIRCNHLAGASVSMEELDHFDAVLVATGAGLPFFMGIPGEQLSGVYSANEFLTRVNLMHANRFPVYDTPIKRGRRVVVVGGGNVAMDSARVARRMGAKVTLVYRRRAEDLPARKAEVERAAEEGVKFLLCTNPVRILGDQSVSGVECVRMEMCDLDQSGRPEAVPVEGSAFTIEADLLVQAIGQGPNPLLIRRLSGVAYGRKGNLVVDENGKTTRERYYAAGDVATGAATVILAMGGAKQAALAIDAMLRGEPFGEGKEE
ncbi:glutamate synthase (NADPH/NADH) small chain [Methanolinea mesophila]|uniref:NADPH-dependent glutamate synthase n=1 Tax=Methanolinea mesophila TaxID=547055 RepID=UPI001AE96C6C|nr:NADPH-dependent glutamate synthase [Methanolinea mesophila]MBP1927847.1 glutamate synthase (NADPH/NADH) small chain [Methanolinea mesophila]